MCERGEGSVINLTTDLYIYICVEEKKALLVSHKTLPWLSCSHCSLLFNQDSKSSLRLSRHHSPGATSPNMVNFTLVGKWARWPRRPVLGKDKKSTYCATRAIHNGIMRLLRTSGAAPFARAHCCCSFAIVHKRHVIPPYPTPQTSAAGARLAAAPFLEGWEAQEGGGGCFFKIVSPLLPHRLAS